MFIDQQTRCSVPNKFTATGYGEPLTFSNNNPGPPACNIRLEISAISKSGSTKVLILLNCPRSSNSFKKPLKSLAIVFKNFYVYFYIMTVFNN